MTDADPSRRPEPASAAAYRELLVVVEAADGSFYEGDRAIDDPATLLEGYLFLPTVLQVAMTAFVHADPLRPVLATIAGPDVPTMRWGGDNSDSRYRHCPIDPSRTYRIRATVGDAVYTSVTVYAGPDDGRWSDRIVGIVNTRDLRPDAAGGWELLVGPDVEPGRGIRTDPGATDIVTRDYVNDPQGDRPTEWSIELLGDPPGPPRLDDADLANRFRRAANFVRDLTSIVPLSLAEHRNVMHEPYPVPEMTYGWAAGDAAYALGGFDLDDDEALVIEGRSPACAFWNVCLWNPFLAGFDYRYEQVTLNGSQARVEPDGAWRLVVTAADAEVPNRLSTAGHRSGVIWFRWFLPAETPGPLTTRVVPVSELGDG